MSAVDLIKQTMKAKSAASAARAKGGSPPARWDFRPFFESGAAAGSSALTIQIGSTLSFNIIMGADYIQHVERLRRAPEWPGPQRSW
ncbi:hypothetical protein JM946_09605 [Steroidobacter sp. S1-65]|uniref:Uncharacterized protein n=1 Tax=Steroidobacter gossypii TaxID=2805490 RepID=A0ABS1WVK2_9GAMM|nr:hypothetical protein [Steroidobacter gossypii]MBM0105006.1 hypothetical protein [Steroidobacter gossypii]